MMTVVGRERFDFRALVSHGAYCPPARYLSHRMLTVSPPTSSLDDEPFIVASPTDDHPKSKLENPRTESEGDDDSEDDSEAEPSRSVKRRFENIRDSLREKTISLTDRDRFHHFLRENEDILDEIVEYGTLLHYLVEGARDKRFSRYEPLVEHLVRRYPVLLARKDHSERTVLSWAIQKKRISLVRCICANHPQINQVIAVQGLHARNCLHVAIHEEAAPALILELINKASLEALLALDDKGNTPLHLAVAYERCTDAGLSVVKALIDRCDKALDAQTSTTNRLSPYRYHLYTRTEAEAKMSRRKHVEQQQPQGMKEVGLPMNKGSAGRDNVMLPPSLAPINLPLPDHKPPSDNRLGMPRRSNTLNELHPSPKPQSGSIGDLAFVTALAVHDKPLTMDKSFKFANSTANEPRKTSTKKASEEMVVTKQTADAIRDHLKVHYLRTRDHDQAIELLYGRDRPRDLYFDLYESSSRYIDQDWISRGLEYLCFEDTLQYVALPHLELTKKVQSVDSRFARVRSLLPDGEGRRDMVFMFDFLRKKGVSRILRVIVDDTTSPAHSDEAIEQALGGFRVEVWDWRKIDISIDTIISVALDVREVYLYWSGNNAVLRGWSDHGGLAQLKSLRTVHLHVSQGLETAERTKRNVNQFRSRLAALRPDIHIKMEEHRPERSTNLTGPSVEGVREQQVEHRHRWLTCMDNFADFIQNIRPPTGWKEDVRVALIDDGVDIEEKTLRGKIIGGRSFCPRDYAQNLQRSFYVSGSGHGTVMASLICRVCPTAKLFVVKLAEHVSENSTRQITAKSAAKAVRAAIDRQVHIISMSWTIERNEQNAADIRDLEAAIGAAANAGILMFCAANDQGAALDVSFPAACANTKNIFKIGAAEASGAVWKWVGDAAAVDFIFPGHKVVKERPNDAPIDKCQTLTGSSVATAIASGLAALILYCMELSYVQTQAVNQPGKMDHFEGLQRHERMREAFTAIGTTQSSGNKYIEVWNVFEKAVEKSQGKPPDQFPAIVNEVANKLKARKMLE
ncbi:hypothetical protein BP00DRAFT_117362 [Aspergillus indologenus CBS 114.80]|uniref:Peptidase S8/S53 domain-containing protein n=1 Tax=Aspergillus indologenus CBS 114.80 TaxID=1450541 RepID=A0A2V5JD45_9EURO|nr:hypothetical protein BP00DRAFT_117362 [Aspergillus indologenus CBS 114.80]